MCGGFGAWASADAQQMRSCPEQSLSDWHFFGHSCWQVPSQQSSPVVAQSVDVTQDLGHGEYVGFRQSPPTLKLVSSDLMDVQQISPFVVWQSELVAHAFGHSFAPRQTP
jgi:hypothetical protein